MFQENFPGIYIFPFLFAIFCLKGHIFAVGGFEQADWDSRSRRTGFPRAVGRARSSPVGNGLDRSASGTRYGGRVKTRPYGDAGIRSRPVGNGLDRSAFLDGVRRAGQDPPLRGQRTRGRRNRPAPTGSGDIKRPPGRSPGVLMLGLLPDSFRYWH